MLGEVLSSSDQEITQDLSRPTPDLSKLPLFDPLRHAGVSKGKAIHLLRERVSAYPNQPLAWTELARQYLASGLDEKASDAMSCAVQLAPNNRYVLRSAVRFYSRSSEGLDRALWLLRRTPRTPRDPWLLAAEIATADKAEESSPFVKTAKAMLERKRARPRHYSELAAAVGTLEHDHGRHKQAKQFLAQALVDPTGNSLAQAVFLSRSDRRVVVPAQLELRQEDFEANARSHYADGRFELAMSAAKAWLEDEPFDVKPALLGSFLSFDDSLAAAAEEIATLGLSSSPHHPTLLNNRAVSRAYLGDYVGAFDDIKGAAKTSRDEPSHLATLGLLAYRIGSQQFGRDCYTKAIAWFASIGDLASVYRASLYWSRERARIGDTQVEPDLEFIKGRIQKLPLEQQESDLIALVNAVEREMLAGPAQDLWKPIPEAHPAALESVQSSFRIPEPALARAKVFEVDALPLITS
ncbi:hypothetical protein J3U96_03685 [Stenotrophomonas maltophilia]|nr:hypothetical protein J3U96_03685 [Stenotrophomonas maltophilia]